MIITIEEFKKIEIIKALYEYFPAYEWEAIHILFNHKISTKEFSNLKENSIKAFKKMLKDKEIDYTLDAFLDLIHECYKNMELIEDEYCDSDVKYYIELLAYHYILSINFKDYMIKSNSVDKYNIALGDLKSVIIKKFNYTNFAYYFFRNREAYK